MPTYRYKEKTTGLIIELLRPVDQRDAPLAFERVTAPETLAIKGAAADPFSMEAGVRAGLRRLEDRGETRRIDRSPRELKQIWGA